MSKPEKPEFKVEEFVPVFNSASAATIEDARGVPLGTLAVSYGKIGIIGKIEAKIDVANQPPIEGEFFVNDNGDVAYTNKNAVILVQAGARQEAIETYRFVSSGVDIQRSSEGDAAALGRGSVIINPAFSDEHTSAILRIPASFQLAERAILVSAGQHPLT